MKKVKDFIEMTEGLFYTFYQISQNDYIELFGDMPPDSLDFDFYNMCSQRYASPLLANSENNEQVVKILLMKYLEQWKRIKTVLTAEYDALTPYYKETTRNEDKTGVSTSETSGKDKNSIYGFNSDEASGKDESENENSNSTNSQDSTVLTEVTQGNNGNQTQADIIAKELEIRKMSFYNVVLNDCKEQLTLSIY